MNGIADPDPLAAEYVLGTLDSSERAEARDLLSTSEAFVAKVKLWERRLGELHLMVEPVEPDDRIWERIKARILPPSPELPVDQPEPAAPEAIPAVTREPERPSPPIVPAASSEAVTPDPIPDPPMPDVVAEPAMPEPVTPQAVEELPMPEIAVSAPREPSPPSTPVTPTLGPAAPSSAGPAPELAADVPLSASVAFGRAVQVMGRRLAGWRALALLMTLVVMSAAALVAAWRFVPERVPPYLQPLELLRRVGVSLPTPAISEAPARPRPPVSRYDE